MVHGGKKDLDLLDSDKTVVTTGAWINCSAINYCQFTMHNQFSLPHFSCQDVLYGLTMNYSAVDPGFMMHMVTKSLADC